MMKLSMLLPLVALATANPRYNRAQPFSNFIQARQENGDSSTNSSSPQVDLGYSVYQGYANSTSNINVFQGIRFARPPIGNLRWQAPQPPTLNRTGTVQATSYAAQCPQNNDASYTFMPANQTFSSEDCLFLNVYSPRNMSSPLPVFVWIHGGGYGAGNGRVDFQPLITANNNGFVAVAIQYRLGAFGFLSSDEVYRKGVVNAGILDQHFALQWVQQYIHLFNGDPDQVTIGGESAGGGSVMLQDMAYGGSLGTQLFRNTIAASPFLPMQYGYNDWIPSQSYYSFAARAGCNMNLPYLASNSTPIFECLLNISSDALINASATISQAGSYGTWAFLPVTDGVFVQDLPSRQLNKGKVNGANALVGNNADEGFLFVPQYINTEDDLVAWLRTTFPLFSTNDISKVLKYYPGNNASMSSNATRFATAGDSGPTIVDQSSTATGPQQRANAIYAETTFICPAYWLTEAYSENGLGGQAYKYQYSFAPALHGQDVGGWANQAGTAPYPYDFALAFQKIYGNFIMNSDPSIATSIAVGATAMSMNATSAMNSTTSTNSTSAGAAAAAAFPPYSINAPYQVDLNTTCGSGRIPVQDHPGLFYCSGPGTDNNFRLVNADTWEGGRGMRCDFWRAMGGLVPE